MNKMQFLIAVIVLFSPFIELQVAQSPLTVSSRSPAT